MSEPKRNVGLRTLQRALGGMTDPFSALNRPMYSPAGQPWVPPADVIDSPTHIVIRMEVPGVDRRELSIMQEGRLIIVEGERVRPPGEEHQASLLMMEIQYGPFGRVFELPEYVNVEDIQAVYRQGFLTIRIRKSPTPPHCVNFIRINIQESS